jgi:hypothetical protein
MSYGSHLRGREVMLHHHHNLLKRVLADHLPASTLPAPTVVSGHMSTRACKHFERAGRRAGIDAQVKRLLPAAGPRRVVLCRAHFGAALLPVAQKLRLGDLLGQSEHLAYP